MGQRRSSERARIQAVSTAFFSTRTHGWIYTTAIGLDSAFPLALIARTGSISLLRVTHLLSELAKASVVGLRLRAPKHLLQISPRRPSQLGQSRPIPRQSLVCCDLCDGEVAHDFLFQIRDSFFSCPPPPLPPPSSATSSSAPSQIPPTTTPSSAASSTVAPTVGAGGSLGQSVHRPSPLPPPPSSHLRSPPSGLPPHPRLPLFPPPFQCQPATTTAAAALSWCLLR